MTRRSAAIAALQKADKELAAYTGRDGTPEYQRLAAAVESAYNNPDLPDRYRDPRDRKNAHKLRCKCRTPLVDRDGYCLNCGCTA